MKFESYIKEGKSDFWKTVEGSEYLINQLGKNVYQVAVFTRGDTPTKIYKCNGDENHMMCNCPSRKTCKHIKLVKDWIKAGKPENPFFAGSVKKVKEYIK
jgi:hypothetical protein